MSIGIGLAGPGMVADTHLAAIDALADRARLRAILSRDAARGGAWLAARDREAGVHADADDLAADPDVAVVVICTPPNARAPLIDACIRHRKPVLMEKPVARDLAEAIDLVARCEAADLPLGIVLQHRMRPAAQRLRGLLDDGAIGRVATVDVAVPWWRPQSYYDVPGRGTYARDGGGVLMNQAIHTLDLALHLAGPVTRCQAMLRRSDLHRMEAEDLAVLGLDFASGAVGAVVATTAAFPGGAERIALHGSRGSAVLSGDALRVDWHDGRVDGADAPTRGTGGGADPMAFTSDWHRAILADFLDALAQGRPPAVTGRAALDVHRLIDAATRSSAEGRAIRVGDAA